jgi:hypothetical protein
MKQLRLFSTLFLLVLLSFPFFYKMGYLFYFSLNREFIIQEYCVNKAVAELKCDGKCYLKRGLSLNCEVQKDTSQDNKDIPLLPFIKELKNLQLYFVLPDSDSVVQAVREVSSKLFMEGSTFYTYKSPISGDFSNAVFHPPCV